MLADNIMADTDVTNIQNSSEQNFQEFMYLVEYRYSRGHFAAYIVVSAFMLLIALIGGAVNIYAAFLIVKTKDFKENGVNLVLLNICIADGIMAVSGGVLSFITTVNGYFVFGYGMCIFMGFVVSLTGLTTQTSNMVLAIERYCVVCRPFGFRPPSKLSPFIGVWFSWGWGLLWSTPSLFIPNGYALEALGTTCAPNYYNINTSGKLYIYFLFAFCFFFPLVVISSSYGRIIVYLQKIAKQSSIRRKDGPDAKTRAVTRTTGLVVVAFLISWTPYAIVGIAATFAGYSFGITLETIAVLCAKSSSIYGSVIYILVNRTANNSNARPSVDQHPPIPLSNVIQENHDLGAA